eukprot:760761-Prorocentrum_minimum.AAC.1
MHYRMPSEAEDGRHPPQAISYKRSHRSGASCTNLQREDGGALPVPSDGLGKRLQQGGHRRQQQLCLLALNVCQPITSSALAPSARNR